MNDILILLCTVTVITSTAMYINRKVDKVLEKERKKQEKGKNKKKKKRGK